MAYLWLEALQMHAPTEIEAGFRRWFATSKFFPKPAEIAEAGALAVKQAAHEAQLAKMRAAPALPQGIDPEQAERNRKGFAAISAMLAGKHITPKNRRRATVGQ